MTRASHLPFAALDPDQAAAQAVRAAASAHERDRPEPLGPVLAARKLGSYLGYAGTLRALLDLEARGARLELLGKSVRGEPLVGVRIGAPDAARTTVLLAGVHPIEWIGIQSAVALASRLVDAAIDGRLEGRQILAVPMVNPDGIRKVEDNLRSGRRRFVRHNARGVDLNRNFETGWGERGLVGRLSGRTFHAGRAAASEPEIEALAVATEGLRVDRALSLHSFGGVVLYPRARSLRPIRDRAEHHALAEGIALAIDPTPYRALACAWWSKGLSSEGGLEVDWFHERHGAVSLLVECSRGGLALGHPRSWLEPFAWFNPRAPGPIALGVAEASLPFCAPGVRS